MKKYALKGGFYLSDNRIGGLKQLLKEHFSKDKYGKLYEYTKDPKPENFQDAIKIMISPEYTDIYKKFTDIYRDKSKYTQRYVREDGTVISEIQEVDKSHVNMGALIFLSFLLGLDTFMAIYSIIKVNTDQRDTDGKLIDIHNDLPPVPFVGNKPEYKFHIYRSIVKNDISNLIDIFTYSLDKLFNNVVKDIAKYILDELNKKIIDKFVDKLIERGEGDIEDTPGISIDEIYACITPIEKKEYIKDEYNNIYKDWMERIVTLYRIKYNEYIHEDLDDDQNRYEIMTIIADAIEKVLKQLKSIKYMTESPDMFSFLFFIENRDTGEYGGSCITSSLYEFYILTRLHANPNDLWISLESDKDIKHPFWIEIQKDLDIDYFSHWITLWDFFSKQIKFRSVYVNEFVYNLELHKMDIYILLLYPILSINRIYIQNYSEQYEKVIHTFIYSRLLLLRELSNIPDSRYNMYNIRWIYTKIGMLNEIQDKDKFKFLIDHLFRYMMQYISGYITS